MTELKKLNLTDDKSSPKNVTPNTSQMPTTSPTSTTPSSRKIIAPIAIVLAIFAGIGTGFAIFQFMPGKSPTITSITSQSAGGVKVGEIFGIDDTSAFPDIAEGLLKQGGIEGEGSHHLVREGGESKNVYLTSSVVDLDELTGHKVQVWGETFAAQTAGWLMDVGKIKIIELDAPDPDN